MKSAKKIASSKAAEASNKAVLARLDDGTIQITLSIPQEKIAQAQEEVIAEFVKEIEVPGFRKGKAPLDIATKRLDKQKVYEHSLQHLLPEAYANAIEGHQLRPILAPRFELISVEEDKDWVVRAITCEVPSIDLGDYKKAIKDSGKVDLILTPETDKEKDKEQTREEKEQQVIKALLDNVKIKLPRVLVEEEVNHKLSQLLEQVQRLGLTVEQYMASTGRTVEQLREEYARQAEDSIKLVLLLNKVGDEEKITVTETEVDEVVNASLNATGDSAARESIDTPEQKRLVYSILLRRKTLDSLVSLI